MSGIYPILCKAGVRSSEGKDGGSLRVFLSLQRAGTPESNSTSQAGAGLDARTEGETSAAAKSHVPAQSSLSSLSRPKRRLSGAAEPSRSSPDTCWSGSSKGSSLRVRLPLPVVAFAPCWAHISHCSHFAGPTESLEPCPGRARGLQSLPPGTTMLEEPGPNGQARPWRGGWVLGG